MTPKPVAVPSASDEAVSLDDATMTSIFWLIVTVALVFAAVWFSPGPGDPAPSAPTSTATSTSTPAVSAGTSPEPAAGS
mgnify:CR=1 FL=1